MGETIRYGVIGTGMMGLEHIANIRALDGASVVAVSDPNGGSRAAAVDACGDDPVTAFEHHGDLVANGGCDAVVVATPNMTHAEIIHDLLPTDLHLLVEKPLCTTVEDARSVVEAAEGREAMLWVGLEYRYMPPVARLISELDDGVVGDVRMVAIREHRFPFLDKVGHWNRFNANTGGTLVEKCCHFFDLMNLFVGQRPTSVFASGGQAVNHLDEVYAEGAPDILDHAFVIIEYDGGARAMLDLCMFADATQNQSEISVVGDRGKAEALIPDDVLRVGRRGSHWIGQVDEVSVVNDIPFQGLHHGSSFIEHERFVRAIRNGSGPEVEPAHGLQAVAIGVAGQRSIAEGRPIPISEVTVPGDWD